MPRFYWKLLRRTPFLLWESAKKWDTVAGIATLCLLEFGVRVAWMPWWLVFLQIVLLFLYGLMKANQEELTFGGDMSLGSLATQSCPRHAKRDAKGIGACCWMRSHG